MFQYQLSLNAGRKYSKMLRRSLTTDLIQREKVKDKFEVCLLL